MKKVILTCVWMVVCAGCESDSGQTLVPADAAASSSSTGSTTTDTTQTSGDGSSTTTAATNGFDFGAVEWGGQSFASATTVNMTMNSASVGSGLIRFDYTMNDSWPLYSGSQAIACMFMKHSDGTWYGGKFDWISQGGQSVKSTENIDGGYGAFASEKPSSGQTVAFLWVSVDGVYRSNEAITTWQ